MFHVLQRTICKISSCLYLICNPLKIKTLLLLLLLLLLLCPTHVLESILDSFTIAIESDHMTACIFFIPISLVNSTTSATCLKMY